MLKCRGHFRCAPALTYLSRWIIIMVDVSIICIVLNVISSIHGRNFQWHQKGSYLFDRKDLYVRRRVLP